MQDAEEGTVIVADKQNKGKGRLGKSWYSPDGGLWFSVILRPQNLLVFPIIAGVAVCEAIKEMGLKTQIKWPNDILVKNRKVAGILAELVDKTVILGIGLNLNITEFPEEIKDSATSILMETGKPFNKDKALQVLFRKIEEKHQTLENGNVPTLLDEWRKLSTTLGKKVTITTPKEALQGKAIDIDEDGALLLETLSGSIEKIIAGECSLKEL